ncbi:stalk domain-containing protein [Paenibacillus sp. GCM10027627]|uniref:stalk domain-containing protein n=1 Tax=unclassified Paenibacillus TaxID=185978 RepID=UPI00362FD346
MFKKLSKIAIAFAIAFGTFTWYSGDTTHAQVSSPLDKGLETEIREELGLKANEPVTSDEVHILRGLVIEDAKTVRSLTGLEEAFFLNYLFIGGSNSSLDISPLLEIDLGVLAINTKALNQGGQRIISELKKAGVLIVDLSESEQYTAPIKVFVDGEQLELTPVVVNGTTMVPFRPLFEHFGLSIGWDNKTRTVTGTKEKLKISMVINNKTANVSGQKVSLPVAPTIKNGTTLVPLRFIGEATGKRVIWDGHVRTIHIDSTITSINFEVLYAHATEYTGGQQNGLPHGQGKLHYKGKLFYEGQFVNGVIEGQGKMYDLTDSNSYYEGTFVNNRFHGNGKLFYNNGGYYEGPFVNGMREGNGKLVAEDGTLIYTGSFSLDTMHGEGTYNMGSKFQYVGSFKYGLYHGYGKFYFNGQLQYEGEWYENYRYHGDSSIGSMKYTGYFNDDQPHGYGTLYHEDGSLAYRGEVRWYELTGIGIIYLEDGDRYIGEVYNALPDGFGFIKLGDNKTVVQIGYYVDGEYYGEEPPPQTEDSTIKELLRYSDAGYINGFMQNEFGLKENESMYFIHLSFEEDVELFNSLSKAGKAKLINSYIQRHWIDVILAEKVYAYVMYDGIIYAEATLTPDMADSAVSVSEFPQGKEELKKP